LRKRDKERRMNMKECERLRKIEKVGENEREIEKY